jgi:luciferase family oxidoreductase group 1
LAAYLGLPFAFASHFAPAMMMEAIAIYRERFRPSAQLPAPHVMLGLNIVAAETDDEARYLFSSLQQSFINIRSGRPGRLPPPAADFDSHIDPYARAMLDDALVCAIVGNAQTVREGMEAFVERTGADELMVTANIFDHAKRKRSFAIAAEVGGCTVRAHQDQMSA